MNKVALITGGSRGLGRSAALKLAERNVDIVLMYHSNNQTAPEVVEQIKQKGQKVAAI